MTLDEAIIHAEEIADKCATTDGDIRCESEHRQLAEWLKELRDRRRKEGEPNDRINNQADCDEFYNRQYQIYCG